MIESKTELQKICNEYIENAEPFKYRLWRNPCIGIADAYNTEFYKLKEIVHPLHEMPSDFVEDAKSVIAIFVPFSKIVIESNTGGEYSSSLWDEAYEETNAMIAGLNTNLCEYFKKKGYTANATPATINNGVKAVTSNWSHRHVGVIAGIGTFGINNMIITEKGCAGRMTSLVTNALYAFDNPIREERCLAKKSGVCMECVEVCPLKAISYDNGNISLDKQKCVYQIYDRAKEDGVENGGCNCGKCSCGVYCSYFE